MRCVAMLISLSLTAMPLAACKAEPPGCQSSLVEEASSSLLFSELDFPLVGLESALLTPLSTPASVEELWLNNPSLGEVPAMDFTKEQVVVVLVTTRTCADYEEVVGFFMGGRNQPVARVETHDFCGNCDTGSDPFYDVYRVPQGVLSECRIKIEECAGER